MKLDEVQVLHCVPCSQEELLQTQQIVCRKNKHYLLKGKNRGVQHPFWGISSTDAGVLQPLWWMSHRKLGLVLEGPSVGVTQEVDHIWPHEITSEIIYRSPLLTNSAKSPKSSPPELSISLTHKNLDLLSTWFANLAKRQLQFVNVDEIIPKIFTCTSLAGHFTWYVL